MMGKKTVVVDTDIGLRNLDVVLGLENRIVYNLVDVVNGSCRLKQALIKDKRHPELYLLPSAQTKDKTAVSPEQMIKLTDDLREEFDYILLDCPAGIEQGFKNAIAGADKALVVTTPEVSAIRDADRIIGLLEANDLRDIPQIICFQKTNDTIRIANCGYLRGRHYKSFICTCNGILKSLLNSSRTVQQYIIKLLPQIIRQFDHLFR